MDGKEAGPQLPDWGWGWKAEEAPEAEEILGVSDATLETGKEPKTM